MKLLSYAIAILFAMISAMALNSCEIEENIQKSFDADTTHSAATKDDEAVDSSGDTEQVNPPDNDSSDSETVESETKQSAANDKNWTIPA